MQKTELYRSTALTKKLLATSLGLCLLGGTALAKDADNTAQSESGVSDQTASYHSAGNQPGTGGFSGPDSTKSLWDQDQLLGSMGGLRYWLLNYGVTVNLTETSEYLGNTSGGTKQGFDYDGLTTMTLQLDTKRAFNWYGGTFNVSALEMHGSNVSAHNLQSLQTASGIEADNGVRVWEAWYDQLLWHNQADIKVGQQSLDQEFMVSSNALLFVNTMFGWPMVPSADMIGGGPAYPLSSPGVRIRLQPEGAPAWTFLGGVFDDNPSGLGPTSDKDSQRLNSYGTNFRVNDSALVIGEVQYSFPSVGDSERGDQKTLPGTYRLGGWYDFGQFADQRFGTDGLSLALGNGDPRIHRGNYSIYAVGDQMVWRENAENVGGVSLFFRGMGAPSDRNQITYSINAGITYHEPFEHRENDTVGLGLGYANVSSADRELDADSGLPIKRSGETFVEATYQYAIAPWWQVQPDVQYVMNPGAGITDPNNPTSTKRLGNELVIGLRTNITF